VPDRENNEERSAGAVDECGRIAVERVDRVDDGHKKNDDLGVSEMNVDALTGGGRRFASGVPLRVFVEWRDHAYISMHQYAETEAKTSVKGSVLVTNEASGRAL
jgi:hypothetical protein